MLSSQLNLHCFGEMLAHVFHKRMSAGKIYITHKEKCPDFQKSCEKSKQFTQEGCGIYLLEIFSSRQETHMFGFISAQFEMNRMGSSRVSQSFSFCHMPRNRLQSSCHPPSQASIQPSPEAIFPQFLVIAYQTLLIEKVKLKNFHVVLVGWGRGDCKLVQSPWWIVFQNPPKLKCISLCSYNYISRTLSYRSSHTFQKDLRISDLPQQCL